MPHTARPFGPLEVATVLALALATGCTTGSADVSTTVREISFDAVDFTYEDLDLSDIVTGETIRFEMENKGDKPHEFEVLDPSDEPVGEIAGIAAGYSGGATMTFEAPGVYTYQCVLTLGYGSTTVHTELGMIGTFEVPES